MASCVYSLVVEKNGCPPKLDYKSLTLTLTTHALPLTLFSETFFIFSVVSILNCS